MAEWYFHKPEKDCVIALAKILYAAIASGRIGCYCLFKWNVASSLGFKSKITPCLTNWLSTAVLLHTKILVGHLKDLL